MIVFVLLEVLNVNNLLVTFFQQKSHTSIRRKRTYHGCPCSVCLYHASMQRPTFETLKQSRISYSRQNQKCIIHCTDLESATEDMEMRGLKGEDGPYRNMWDNSYTHGQPYRDTGDRRNCNPSVVTQEVLGPSECTSVEFFLKEVEPALGDPANMMVTVLGTDCF